MSAQPPTLPAPAAVPSLRLAVVLAAAEEECTVVLDGSAQRVAYAAPFPRPRADRVFPGHLVAVAGPDGATPLVVWRWFDAVVVGHEAGLVSLWEPGHGVVRATPRDAAPQYSLGSRAYVSAGLPGAEWWVEGPVVARPEPVAVDLGEVAAFYTSLGLWERLAEEATGAGADG